MSTFLRGKLFPTLLLSACVLWLTQARAEAQISVTPDGGSTSASAHGSGDVSFQVHNLSGADETVNLSCSVSGAVVSCQVFPSSAFVTAGDNVTPLVSFSTGDPGGGTVTLHATATGIFASDDGWYDVTVTQPSPPTVTITPASDTLFGPSLSVTIKWCDDTSLWASTRRITFNEVDVTSNFTYVTQTNEPGCPTRAESEGAVTLNVGSNTLEASISDGVSTGGSLVTYVYDETAPPQVSTAAHNGDILTLDLCGSCFDHTYAYSTPPYFTLDAPGNVTLIYSSQQAAPRGVVVLDVDNQPGNPNPPEKLSLSLKRPDGTWVTFTTGTTEIFYQFGQNGSVRLTAQFDAVGLPTGAHGYTAVVRSWWGSTSEETTLPLRVLILNEQNSPVAPGWTIAGVQTLIPQGDTLIVLLDGAGGITAFKKTNSTPFPFAAYRGDFTKVLKTGTGTYVRFWNDSTKASFSTKADGAIRVDSVKDRFGNRTTFAYSSSTGKLNAITDPMGMTTTFSWFGGELQSTSALGRVTYFDVSATTGDLVRIEDPDGAEHGFTYDGIHRLLSSTDREGSLSEYGYDGWGKLASVTLAQVTLHDGNVVRPRTELSSAVGRALPASGTGSFSVPAPRSTASDMYGVMVGPRGDSTRVWANAFGQPTTIEDAVGRTTAMGYNSDGLPTFQLLPSGQSILYEWTYWFGVPELTREGIDGLWERRYAYEHTYHLPKDARWALEHGLEHS